MNLKEATELWINRDFSYIPSEVCNKLRKIYLENGEGEFEEYTVWNKDDHCNNKYCCSNNEEYSSTNPCDKDSLPMWRTLFCPNESMDQEWIGENIKEISKLGFRIFKEESFGYLLGIDGAGYNFYTDHWIPLYKLRGLHWHNEKLES